MIFSHVLYQLSYLAFHFCARFGRAPRAIVQKSEYNTQVFAGTFVEADHNEPCPRASKAFRFPTAPSGES